MKKQLMLKRIIVMPLIIAAIMGTALLSVQALTSADFTLGGAVCDNNRLFTLEMTSSGDGKLCAALFEFEYDTSIMEFRKATAENGSKVRCKESNGTVKLSYLDTYGVDVNGGRTIFSLTFKSISSGSGRVSFSVNDVVNADIKSVSVGECKSAVVTVSSKSVGSTSGGSVTAVNGNKSSSSTKSDAASGKSDTSSPSPSTANPIIDLGKINDVYPQAKDNFWAGIALGASAMVLMIVVYLIINKNREKLKKLFKKKTDEDDFPDTDSGTLSSDDT